MQVQRNSAMQGCHRCVDVGCYLNHTLERVLDVRAAKDRSTQRGYHSYVVKHGEVYKANHQRITNVLA
jgi:hypothetical protein